MVEASTFPLCVGFFELAAELPVNGKDTPNVVRSVNPTHAGRQKGACKRSRNDRDRVGRKLLLHSRSPVVVRTNTVADRGGAASLSTEGGAA